MEWLDILGYEGLYTVDENGNIYSKRSRKTLKPKTDKYGYKVVALSRNGAVKYKTVHRIVATAFIPNPACKPTVNHINENKSDNRVCNLEWVTHKENDNFGSRNTRMSLSKSKHPVIRTVDGTEEMFLGVKDASRKTGISHSQITRYCRNIGNSIHNKEWRYISE